MKNSFVGKGFVLGLMLLFIGASIIPSTVEINKEKQNSTNNNSIKAKELNDTTSISTDPQSQTVSP